MPRPLLPNQTAALLLDAASAGTAAEQAAVRGAIEDLHLMVAQGHLSRIRRLAGISQDVIATTLGCSQAAVSQWERGVVPPDPALALRLHSLVRALEASLVAEGKWAQPADVPGNWSPPPAVVPAPVVQR